MTSMPITRRRLARALAGGALAMPAIGLGSRTVNAASPVQLIAYRYPSSEFYANAMKNAVPGTALDVQLMPSDKAMELVNINLSSRSANLDILQNTDMLVSGMVRNGWLRPLNDLWDKYKEEFALDDIDSNIVQNLTIDGKLYVVPTEFNSLIQFYRTDLFEKKGLKPATTLDEYKSNAAALQTSSMAGLFMLGRVGDPLTTETHYYLNNIGEGWFDQNWQPLFNSDKGIQAIQFMKEISAYAQRGFATAGSDEAALAMQQGFAAMGNHYVTRVAPMMNPDQSRYYDHIALAPAAQGNQRISLTGYAISAFSKQDPDLMFRIIMGAAKTDTMRGNVANNVPTRTSLLKNAELRAKYPYLVVAEKAAKAGKTLPHMPYFFSVGDIVSRHVSQVLTNERQPKEAMDLAAKEVRDLLTSNGFYKG